MPDPVNPTPPPAASSAPTSTGLPSNVAAALACIPLIGGLIFYIIEKNDRFVRFYAMQSIIFGGIWFLFNIVSWILHGIFSLIPIAGPIFGALWLFVSALIHLGLLVVMVIAMVKAFSNVLWEIPWVGPIARKQMGEV
jgi:uncharacterized membrane protein